MRGLLITFEGCDGSGKSTQIKLLTQRLEAAGIEMVITREPGGTAFGEAVRALLLNPKGPDRLLLSELFLYMSARAEIVGRVIKPSLSAGKVVITERYIDSTWVYQGFAGGIPTGTIETVNKIATEGIMPDVTFLLDIKDPNVINDRLAYRQKDKIESRNDKYHSDVREGYRVLAAQFPERVVIINAEQAPDKVAEGVWKKVKSLF